MTVPVTEDKPVQRARAYELVETFTDDDFADFTKFVSEANKSFKQQGFELVIQKREAIR